MRLFAGIFLATVVLSACGSGDQGAESATFQSPSPRSLGEGKGAGLLDFQAPKLGVAPSTEATSLERTWPCGFGPRGEGRAGRMRRPVAQVARDYEGKVRFLTSPGLDNEKAMEQAVEDFKWPNSMTHAIDRDGSLWEHLEVRYRGAWIFLNDDGEVSFRSVTHIPEKEVRSHLEELTSR